MTGSALVIGIGNDFRSDDGGVGIAVAAEVASRRPPGVEVLSAVSDPGQILDAWADVPLVVVVDAASGPDVSPEGFGTGFPATTTSMMVSSHSLGCRRSTRWARRLADFRGGWWCSPSRSRTSVMGVGLSPPVADAVPAAVEAVLAEVGRQP